MVNKKRLLWLCRRGIREMDLLFKQFLDEYYEKLSEPELNTLESLLKETDLDIMDWIMGRSEPNNPDYKFIIEQMKQLNSRQLKDN